MFIIKTNITGVAPLPEKKEILVTNDQEQNNDFIFLKYGGVLMVVVTLVVFMVVTFYRYRGSLVVRAVVRVCFVAWAAFRGQ